MSQLEIENLLYQAMGLDVASIGSASIERAVSIRMTQIGAVSVADYWGRLRASSPELQELVETVVVPETWFFRHCEAFDALNRFALEEWLPSHQWGILRALSIPCSTGEEPYSIAMSLLDAGLPAERFTVEAWDISHRALERAERAIYSRNSFRSGNLEFRERYFQAKGELYQVGEAVRRQVTFRHVNLLSPEHQASAARYDVLFCRNVLIYFDRPMQQSAMANLKHLLLPQGIAFVGPAEALLMRSGGFVPTNAAMSFGFRHSAASSRSSSSFLQPAFSSKPPPTTTNKTALRPTLKPLARAPEAVLPRNPTKISATSSPLPTPDKNELETAQQLADSGRMQDAEQKCEAFLRGHSDSADGYYLLGVIRDALGDTLSAAQSYRKSLYLNPNHSGALVHLALLAERRGDTGEARRLQERARRVAEAGGI